MRPQVCRFAPHRPTREYPFGDSRVEQQTLLVADVTDERRGMSMRVRALAALAVLAVAWSLVPAGAATRTVYKTRTVTADYVGSSDPLTFGQCKSTRVPTNVGKVCLPLKAADKSVTFSIKDQALGDPGFFYMFIDAGGSCVGDSDDPTSSCPNTGSGCGRASRVGVPKGAVRLEVFPSGAALGTLKCTIQETNDSPGPSAVGTVTAKITYAVRA